MLANIFIQRSLNRVIFGVIKTQSRLDVRITTVKEISKRV